MDAAGSAYVTGSSSSVNPSTATQRFGPLGSAYAIVFKISPDGSKEIYETALGGSVQAGGTAIAVNNAGEVYVAGSTSSVDFPLVHPLQSTPGARPLWKSGDNGATWAPIDDLPFALVQALVVDPSNPTTLYAATGDLGVFKSVDGGATWTRSSTGIAGTNTQALAIDPLQPQTMYAAMAAANGASPSAVYKTVDGAKSWTLADSPPISISQLAVDAKNSNIVYEIGGTIRKSTDGGATWATVTFPGTVQSMVLDPGVSGNLLAISNMVFCGFLCSNNQASYLYRSVDGGAHWVQQPLPASNTLVVDASTSPSTVYDGLGVRSVDGGATWSPTTPPPGPFSSSSTFAVDPSGTVYAAVSGTNANFVSHDRGQSWTAIGTFIPPWRSASSGPVVNRIVPAGTSGTLYTTIFQTATSGFVTRLSADGSKIMYSTYLRGHASMGSYVIFAAEPGVFLTQSWISSIALDAAGNATVAGGTRAADFPVVTPAQTTSHGQADIFAATISADGSKLNDSTYFGGSEDDSALAVALDSQGNVILAGQTWSFDFPIPGGVQPPTGYGEAFVVKLAPPGPAVITSVLNGASYQPGIEAGSWVMIQGANLASTSPGRTWRGDEVVNGNLPTSLDGVSVTIDGKPAFVYYISPTQINVQAPSDSTVGTVNVVVNNNGNISAPATAQLQTVAPAFFMYPGTNYAVASRLPDYALVGDPSSIPGTVAAKAGDTLVLWGTGFGATNPVVPAGTAVSGAPAVVTAPTVKVGAVAAQVIGTVLTAGSAGLYQVTIQLPSAVPTGAVPVQASVDGVPAQAGVLLFCE